VGVKPPRGRLFHLFGLFRQENIRHRRTNTPAAYKAPTFGMQREIFLENSKPSRPSAVFADNARNLQRLSHWQAEKCTSFQSFQSAIIRRQQRQKSAMQTLLRSPPGQMHRLPISVICQYDKNQK
jgi:hypothetical protein